MRARRTITRLHPAQGAIAWLLAGLVFALGLLTVLPQAHAHLHTHAGDAHAHAHARGDAHDHAAPDAHDDLGCAITLFQHGVTTPLDMPRVVAPVARDLAPRQSFTEQQPPSAARYLLRPVRGPPCIG